MATLYIFTISRSVSCFSERWHLWDGVVRGLSTKKTIAAVACAIADTLWRDFPCCLSNIFSTFLCLLPVTFQIFLVVTGGGAHRKQISRGDVENSPWNPLWRILCENGLFSWRIQAILWSSCDLLVIFLWSSCDLLVILWGRIGWRAQKESLACFQTVWWELWKLWNSGRHQWNQLGDHGQLRLIRTPFGNVSEGGWNSCRNGTTPTQRFGSLVATKLAGPWTLSWRNSVSSQEIFWVAKLLSFFLKHV